MQSGGGPLQPGPSVMRGLGSGTPTSSQQQSDMQKMQSQPPLMNQQQYQQQNLFRNAGANQNTRQPRAMVPTYHSTFIAPVFSMPYNPRMNQWANYASMPGMSPYPHQYYVPQGQFISGQHQQNRRNPGGENNLVNMPQVQMPQGQPNQQSSPMTVSHDLLVMQQLHQPSTQHTPQPGVPGAPGQAQIEQHQPNPAQVNVGAPQPQHTMMPQLQLAPHLTAPTPAPASKVNKKKQRGSRAIPIINPDTQEDLLDIIYKDSTPPTSSATPTTVAPTSGPPPPLPAGAGVGNSAPPQANYSSIPPNVPQVPLNPASVESDYDNYPPHPHQGTPELPGGMLLHHQAPPHLQHPPPNHPPPPTHVHPGQGQMFDMGRSSTGQQPHEMIYPGAGPLKPVNPPPHLPPPPHHTVVSSVPASAAEMTTASGTPVVSANANAPSVEIKPYQQKKKKPISEPPMIIQQPPPSVQPHPQLQQQQQQQLHHHLIHHQHQHQQQQHSLPANINHPPPPTGINMVDMMPIPYGGAPERYRTISEKSIAESTLSTDAEPFVYTGASSNQPPPRVEEVLQPVIPVVIPEVPPPTVVLQEQQVQQQPSHQEATVLLSKTDNVVEPVSVPEQIPIQVQPKRPVDSLMASLEKLSVEDQPTPTVGHTSNSKKNKQHKKRAEETSASETSSNKDSGSSKAPATVAAPPPPTTTTTVVVEQQIKNEAVDETDRCAVVSEEPHQQQSSSSLISNLVEHNSKLDNDNIINNNNVECTSTTITTNNDNTTTTTTTENNNVSPMENDAKRQLDSRQPSPPKVVDAENNVQQQQQPQPEFDDNKNVVESSTPTVSSPSPKESTPIAVEQPTEEQIPVSAPAAASLKAPLAPIKKSRSLTLIEYDADQWSPENPTGKKKYSRDQLMQLKNAPPALEKPINLPNSLENVLGRSNHGGGNHYGKNNFAEMSLLPTFIKDRMVGGGGGGGNMGQMRQPYPPKRSSQQGNQPGSQANKQSQQGMNKTGSKIIRLQLDEEVKLNECENAWRPRHLQQTEAIDETERKTQELFKKFRSVLNKLTPDNFEKLVQQVKSFVIDTDERLGGCIKLVFEKAISEPSFSEAYAKMCKEVGTIAIGSSSEKQKISFKTLLLIQCQAEFERRRNDQDSAIREGRIKLEANKNLAKIQLEELKAQLEEEEQKVRRRAVGTVRFIGELYKHDQLTSSIMHQCIKLLIEKDDKDYDEETLECLCKLLTTIGAKMEKKHEQDLSKYFEKMGEIVRYKEQYRISSRIRFMIQDVIDLRQTSWNPRRQDLNPKTMNQIQKEAETEQFQNTMNYLHRGNDMGRGGRGNMQGSSKMSGSMGSSGYGQGSLGRGGNQGSIKGGRMQTDDDGFQQIQNNRNNRQQLQIDPKKINIPSNLDITARLGSAANYQGWKNNSNIFAALNNEENQATGGGGSGGMLDRDGDRDRDRRDRDRNQRDRDRDRERSGSHNKNSGSRDSYHKGSMEHDRYNRYGSSNSQNDDRVSRSSREPSSGSMRPMSGQHSNNQMHDRDRDRGKLSSQQQQQSTIPGRSSQQRHIPQSTAPPAGKMGPPPSTGSALSKTGSGHLYQQQQLPQYAIPKDVAVRRNFPLPDEETEIELQKFSKMVNIDMKQADFEDSVTMLKELNIKPEFYHAAVSQLLMDNIERDVKSREIVVRVIAQMFEKKVITKADYLHALEEIFKIADDLIIDLPQLYKYVATFYVMLLNNRFINLVDVRNAAQEILSPHGATMLKELLLQYESTYGKDATVMLWYESSLNPTDFIKLASPDLAEKYLTDAKLGYLLDSSSKALDMQTIGTQIKHFLKTNAKFMDIYNWISNFVGTERETSDEFIRTLTKAVIEHCIDGKTKLNQQEIQKWHQILQKYIDNKGERELQAMYAIQRLVVELEHPQNLLHSILEVLYNCDVIMEGFALWIDSKDPLEAAGKGVCLKGITQFLTMFMESWSEEDN